VPDPMAVLLLGVGRSFAPLRETLYWSCAEALRAEPTSSVARSVFMVVAVGFQKKSP
jgi:hypothetical protein